MLKKALIISLLSLPSLAMGQAYVVYDFTKNKVLESRSPNSVMPIASVTKLMTANIFLEHNKKKNCTASITADDYDYIKGTSSKLPKNTPIACSELLKAMFVYSDNYAAHALARSAGMSRTQFIHKMNQKARKLGMRSTRFSDSSGLSSYNVSSVMDLVKLAKYSLQKPELKTLSNVRAAYIRANRKNVFIQNTNKLVREELYDAALSKTGYIRESGYNLVFINKHRCNNSIIGVISLNNASSAGRSNFTQNKLARYGCRGASSFDTAANVSVSEPQAYDEQGLDQLIRKVAR